MRHRIPALAVAVACSLLLAPGSSLAADTVDQQQTNTSQATAFAVPNLRLVQTFTAGKTGTLDTVDVYASGDSSTFVLDGATVLDGQTISLNSGGWTTVHLATPASVLKGALYYIILEPSGGGNITWHGSDTNSYSGGQAQILDINFKNQFYTFPAYGLAKYGSSLGWSTLDFAFRTYINVPPAPTPTPAPVKAPTPAPKASTGATPAASSTDTPVATDTAATTPSPLDTASAAASELAAGATAPAATGSPASPLPSAPAGGSGGSGLPIVAILIVVIVVALAGGGGLLLMRRART